MIISDFIFILFCFHSPVHVSLCVDLSNRIVVLSTLKYLNFLWSNNKKPPTLDKEKKNNQRKKKKKMFSLCLIVVVGSFIFIIYWNIVSFINGFYIKFYYYKKTREKKWRDFSGTETHCTIHNDWHNGLYKTAKIKKREKKNWIKANLVRFTLDILNIIVFTLYVCVCVCDLLCSNVMHKECGQSNKKKKSQKKISRRTTCKTWTIECSKSFSIEKTHVNSICVYLFSTMFRILSFELMKDLWINSFS